MGTAISEKEVYAPLSKNRPKVYLCVDCSNGNEFTKLALEIHRQKCSHLASCTCTVCSSNLHGKRLKKRSKTCSFIPHVSIKIANIPESHDIVKIKNSAKVSDIIQKLQSALSDQPRTNSLKLSENGHSGLSHSNQLQKLHFINSVSKSKSFKRKSGESLDSGGHYPDLKLCDRKIYCMICKMHIFWVSFGTHVLQHSIKTENSPLVCPVCSQKCLLPNHYLMHFFDHMSDHDCKECHCNNDRCPCYAQISTACCYICLNSFADIYSVIPHMITHT